LAKTAPNQHALIIPACFNIEEFPFLLVSNRPRSVGVGEEMLTTTSDSVYTNLYFCNVKIQESDYWRRKQLDIGVS
jgi:hypothetical protein